MRYIEWDESLPTWDEISQELKLNKDAFHIIDIYETKQCPECNRPLPLDDFYGNELCCDCDKLWAENLIPVDTVSLKGKANVRLIARIRFPQRKRCSVENCYQRGERHHIDYNNPTDIIWLCHKHHMASHQRLKRILG